MEEEERILGRRWRTAGHHQPPTAAHIYIQDLCWVALVHLGVCMDVINRDLG